MTNVVKSAARAFAVLELFERERTELGLSTIAANLNLPTSSAAALLKSLVILGYLVYDGSRRTYFPTMRMAGLGGWIEGALFGAGDVMARARRLRELTGLRVMLAVRSDLYAQYLHFVEPGEPTWLSAGPGTLRSLAHSGMGWLLLSAQRDAEIRTLVRRVDYHNRTKTDLAELMNQIRKVRVDGYAVSLNQVTPGFGIMGALLPASLTTRPMAIGFGGRVEEIELRRQELRYHLFAAVAEG